MKKIALIAVATLALAACAGPASGQTPPRTTMVMVNLENPARPWIWIDQEPIIVRGKAVMVWQIATEGYEFPKDGIVFQTGAKQFTDCGPEGKIYRCTNTFAQMGRFKYTIKVQPAKDAKVPKTGPLDPTVVNDR